jgi:hypothetical protein
VSDKDLAPNDCSYITISAEANLSGETVAINASAGAGDAGKPIVLDAAGHIDASMINDGDVDHGTVGGLTDDDHTQYILADGTRPFSSYLDIDEISPPGNPAADKLRLYVEDYKGFPFYSFRDSTGMVRKIVRDSVFVAKNVTGGALLANRAVYASGSSDGVPTIDYARANALATMPSIGVTVEGIADGAFGRVMQVGLVENVDTSSFDAGDTLYVSSTVAGVLVKTAPLYPNIRQEVGVILVKDAAIGRVQVVARSMFNEGILDHGGMLGLTDDDHTQYLERDGSDTMTGNLKWTNNALKDSAATYLSVRNNADSDYSGLRMKMLGIGTAPLTEPVCNVDAGTVAARFVNDGVAHVDNAVAFLFRLKSSTTERTAFSIGGWFTTINDATRTSKISIKGSDNGSYSEIVRMEGTKFIIVQSHTPTGAGDTGTAGTITWDANYLYLCYATDTWARFANSW